MMAGLFGFLLLSTLDVGTPYWQVAVFIFVLGAGLGFTMQIVVTTVQDAVERRDMGSATSSVTFFRTMGGAFGTAVWRSSSRSWSSSGPTRPSPTASRR